MPKNIYISSTFRDLEVYRERLIATIGFLEKDGFFKLGKTMEFMKPDATPSLEQCLEEVKKCEIYILLFGRAYGSCVAGSKDSFTYREFKCASENKKIILPFICDDNAQGMEKISVGWREKRRRDAFIKEVRSAGYSTYGENFSTPYHLCSQLLTVLFKMSPHKWTVRTDVRFFCDRLGPRGRLITFKQKGKLNVFSIFCKETDRPDYFIKRMAQYEFGREQEYIDDPLYPSALAGLDTYDKQRHMLIGHLIQKFLPQGMDVPSRLSDSLRFLKERGLDNIFVKLYLAREDLMTESFLGIMGAFFKELQKACSRFQVTVYYMIIFQFKEREEVDRSLSGFVTGSGKLRSGDVNDIQPWQPVVMQDVRDWISRYVLDEDDEMLVDPAGIDPVLREFYSEEKEGLNMDETFSLLTRIIAKINSINKQKSDYGSAI